MTPTGADRWNLFSAEELAWLSLGLNVAEGEGLLPPMPWTDAYVPFEAGLTKAAEERETLERRRAQGREDDGSHGAY